MQHYNETWQAMEELCDQGLCHAIGVSNFNTAQIDDLIAHASKYRPAVNQVRLFVWQSNALVGWSFSLTLPSCAEASSQSGAWACTTLQAPPCHTAPRRVGHASQGQSKVALGTKSRAVQRSCCRSSAMHTFSKRRCSSTRRKQGDLKRTEPTVRRVELLCVLAQVRCDSVQPARIARPAVGKARRPIAAVGPGDRRDC